MAKKRIPDVKSDEEAAEFWDTHSLADYWDELEVVPSEEFPKPRLKQISLRLLPWQIDRLKRMAAAKGIGYQTMVRMWIAERMANDEHLTQAPVKPAVRAASKPARKTAAKHG